MSSQDDSSIPLSYTPDSAGYKLLELPADLVYLLGSDAPPILTLHPASPVALLKTPNGKTYSFRQKNTSNTLMLLAPVPHDAGQVLQSTGLGAIAMVHEVTELVEVASDAVDGTQAVVEPAGEKLSVGATAKKGKWHEKFGRSR